MEVAFHNWVVTLMCEFSEYQKQQGVRQGRWGLRNNTAQWGWRPAGCLLEGNALSPMDARPQTALRYTRVSIHMEDASKKSRPLGQ